MADSFTANLNLRKPEVGHADDTWGGTSGLNSDLDILDAIFAPAGTGTSVGLHIGTGRTLKVDGGVGGGVFSTQSFILHDVTDSTKQLAILADTVPVGVANVVHAPPQSGTMATQEYVAAQLQGYAPTGTVQQGYYGATAPAGWVFADGRTIGSATSGATNRANADTQALFTLLWGFPNAQFPVPGGRGATAIADWNANKQITLPDHSGRTMAGRDDLSGTNRNLLSPSLGGNSILRGAAGGEAKHTIAVAELPAHTHPITDPLHRHLVTNVFTGTGSGGVSGSVTGADYNFTDQWSNYSATGITVNANTGGGGAANVTQPTIVVDVVIKL